MCTQNRRFPLKNGQTEGVLELPFFKDMAVSRRYRHVPFLKLYHLYDKPQYADGGLY